MHTPVLLQETIEALDVKKDKKYIDATFGEGGHSKEILKMGGIVLGIDWDAENIKKQKQRYTLQKHVTLVEGNYGNIKSIAEKHNFAPCSGIIFDLGLSMEQIRESGRGFSYEKRSEPLDMRINTTLKIKASDIVNSYTKEELYEVLSRNAEEVNSRAIAAAFCVSRSIKKMEMVGDLIDSIERVSKSLAVKARVFQALRVEVNNEYENIKNGLKGAMNILAKNGVLAVITFHPSEDRIVKNFAHENKYVLKGVVRGVRREKFERSAILRIMKAA